MSNNVFKGEFHQDHVTDGSKCWCKERVSIMFNGVKVGTGAVDQSGLLTMTISSDELAKKMAGGRFTSISIMPNTKP